MRSLVPVHTIQETRNGSSSVPAFGRFPWSPEGLFESLFSDAWSGASNPADGTALDIVELDDRILVSAEVPGIDPDALDVSLTGELLTLSAEKKDDLAEGQGRRTWSERRFGSFRRAIKLPCPVDADRVEASHKNGVVTITLYKADAVRPRRIEVKQA